MEHRQIDESDIAERYVTGRLPEEERARFEAHFVDCARCLDRIEVVEGLRRGLSALPITKQERRPPILRMDWRFPLRELQLALRPRALALALGASVALVFSVSIGMTWRAAAHRAKSALEAERLSAAGLEQRLNDAQFALRREREARSALEEQLKRETQPQLQIPVFALIATRGEGLETLRLPSVPQWIMVSLERESPPRFERYRVALLSPDREPLWQGDASPTTSEQVALGLHSSLLPPGTYVFQLEGITRSGSLERVARYPVRVLIAPRE